MKKIIFLAIMLLATPVAKAQTNQAPVYILFRSLGPSEIEYAEDGVDRCPSEDFDANEEEYPSIDFFIIKGNNEYHLCHERKINNHNRLSIYTKPLDFLDTVQYIDWDSEAINMTTEEVKAYIESLHKKERVYMIDKRDFDHENQTMKVIEAKVYLPYKF